MAKKTTAPKSASSLSNEEILQAYREMLLVRRFEERMAQMYQQGKIGGFCHLYIGQEAIAVAAQHALRADDYMITSYRDHAHALVRGSDPMRCAAELFGKATGLVGGKGGSMHFFDVEKNFYGGHGIVGGQIPIATGMAFASKYRQDGRVTMCFLGEAAMNQGTFHESLNMASLWNLPIIYVCENNQYGMGTAVERASAVTDLSRRTAGAYNIEGYAVDAMDFFATHELFKKCADRARQESRPSFVDAVCYRFRGHSMSDPVHSHYRTKEEVEERRKRDPIELVSRHFLENGVYDLAFLEKTDQDIKDEVNDAVKRAVESPDPALESRFADIYAE